MTWSFGCFDDVSIDEFVDFKRVLMCFDRSARADTWDPRNRSGDTCHIMSWWSNMATHSLEMEDLVGKSTRNMGKLITGSNHFP